MTTPSLRRTVLLLLASAAFVIAWCLGLALVASLPLPKWLSVPVVVLGIVLLRIIALVGPTLHIRFGSNPARGSNR